MGRNATNGESTERVYLRGGEKTDRAAGADRYQWEVVLPVPGKRHERGGTDGDGEVDSESAEHGRTVHCDAAASGPV